MTTALADPVAMIEQGAPRMIHNEEELAAYTRQLFALTAKDEPINAEQEAIDLLTLLIETYENELYLIPAASPLDVLSLLMSSHSVNQRELAGELRLSPAAMSMILSGERSLTVPHIRRLALRFSVPPSVFLGDL